jgi:hypothetical protein
MVTAEVAVKSASIQLTLPVFANGNLSNKVPKVIKPKNPSAKREGGLKFNVL